MFVQFVFFHDTDFSWSIIAGFKIGNLVLLAFSSIYVSQAFFFFSMTARFSLKNKKPQYHHPHTKPPHKKYFYWAYGYIL